MRTTILFGACVLIVGLVLATRLSQSTQVFALVAEGGGKFGFIDKTGRLVIPAEFEDAHDFSDGLASVSTVGGNWCFIDGRGQFALNPQYSLAGSFFKGLAPVMQGVGYGLKWGYVDKRGRIIIERQFDFAGEFTQDGLAAVRVGDNYGFINRRGSLVIPPRFRLAFDFSEGLVVVERNGKWVYVNKRSDLPVLEGRRIRRGGPVAIRLQLIP